MQTNLIKKGMANTKIVKIALIQQTGNGPKEMNIRRAVEQIKKAATSRVGEFLEHPLKNTPLGDEAQKFDWRKK